MPHDVIMPALGMAQDKGVIVAWHKKLGDKVKTDDVLMEIETDKATMEVEAGHDGFVAELRAGEGDAIPVGDVVAVISKSADDVKEAPTPAKGAETDEADEPPADAEKADEPVAVNKHQAPATRKPAPKKAPVKPASAHGRVLASPKAKLQAAERGIDLESLVRQGVTEPIHVADLDRYRSQAAAGAAHAPSVLSANVASAAFEEFATWAKSESDGATSRARMLAAFAAGAWRHAISTEQDEPIALSVSSPMADAAATAWFDPDIGGFADTIDEVEDETGALQLFDLTGSGLSDYRSGRMNGAAIVLADDPAGYRLLLHFDEAEMPLVQAARLLSGFSARLADPLRQLL